MSSTPRSVIFSSHEVIEICKIMANALENDTDVAALFGDLGDEESFDGFREGGSSSDDDFRARQLTITGGCKVNVIFK